jgi:DNA-binding NarL/FixJ family response regulator
MPEMLRAIISDLLSCEADISIVGRSNAGDECLRAAREARAAVIIVQDPGDEQSTCLDLVLAEPPLGVLAVSIDGQSAAGVSLVRRPINLDSGGPSILADAIRRMAAELSAATFEQASGETSESARPST